MANNKTDEKIYDIDERHICPICGGILVHSGVNSLKRIDIFTCLEGNSCYKKYARYWDGDYWTDYLG